MWLVAKYWRVKACILSSVNLLLSQRRKLRSREAEAPGAGCWSTAGVGMGLQPEFLCAPPAPPQPLCKTSWGFCSVPSTLLHWDPPGNSIWKVVGQCPLSGGPIPFLDTQAYFSLSAPNASRTQISVLSLPWAWLSRNASNIEQRFYSCFQNAVERHGFIASLSQHALAIPFWY